MGRRDRKARLGLWARLAKRIIVPILLRKLKNEGMKDRLISFVNRRVNLPKLDEEEEERLYTQLYDALVEAIGSILDEL